MREPSSAKEVLPVKYLKVQVMDFLLLGVLVQRILGASQGRVRGGWGMFRIG